jgi:type VI secretion system ImpJ/VasE family protein
MSDQVHWSEGLFLQPQHLQAMQRMLLDRFSAERRLGWPYPYGLIESKLAPGAIEDQKVRFSRLSAILPSGLYVNFTEDSDLPVPNFRHAFESNDPFVVCLGVPLWRANRPNAGEREAGANGRPGPLYRVDQVQLNDENSGDNPQPVELRRINARLLLEDDDQTDLEVIPLLRIMHTSRREPALDPDFIAPCLLLSASEALRAMVRDLAGKVDKARKDLIALMAREKFNADAMQARQFANALRLRTLMRYAAALPQLVQAPAITPFEVYLELGRLLGELDALRPADAAPATPSYDHLSPRAGFRELSHRIGAHLHWEIEPQVLEVPFVAAPDGRTRQAVLKPEHLALPNDYFLAVRTGQDPATVAATVEARNRFKLTTRNLVNQPKAGVRLSKADPLPAGLRGGAGVTYFRIARNDDSAEVWELVKKEQELAATWAGIQTSDFQLTLCMTLPDGVSATVKP